MITTSQVISFVMEGHTGGTQVESLLGGSWWFSAALRGMPHIHSGVNFTESQERMIETYSLKVLLMQ